MSFNIGQALVHGAEAFLTTGNPIAAGVGAVEGGLQSGAPAQPDPTQLTAALGEQPDVLSRVNALANFSNTNDFGIIGGDQ